MRNAVLLTWKCSAFFTLDSWKAARPGIGPAVAGHPRTGRANPCSSPCRSEGGLTTSAGASIPLTDDKALNPTAGRRQLARHRAERLQAGLLVKEGQVCDALAFTAGRTEPPG